MDSYENVVRLSGEIKTNFEFCQEEKGEKLYSFELAVKKPNGKYDMLPILISEKMVNITKHLVGQYVEIEGRIRSYGSKSKMEKKLYVFVEYLKFTERNQYVEDVNEVILVGNLCNQPIVRDITVGNRKKQKVTNIKLSSLRRRWKFDYIYASVFGYEAIMISQIEAGKLIHVLGRLQSRNKYTKLEDGSQRKHTVYDVLADVVAVD